MPGQPTVPFPATRSLVDHKMAKQLAGLRCQCDKRPDVTDIQKTAVRNFQPTNHSTGGRLVRIDFSINEKHSLLWRYIHDNYNLIDPFGTFSQGGVLPTTLPTPASGYSISGEVWLINSNLVNTARVNASWNSQHIPPLATPGNGPVRLCLSNRVQWRTIRWNSDVTVGPITDVQTRKVVVPGLAPFEGPASPCSRPSRISHNGRL